MLGLNADGMLDPNSTIYRWGFSVIAPEWKNGCAGTGVTFSDFLPVAHGWKLTVEGQWPLGVICTGRRQAGPQLSAFLSPPPRP